MLIWVLFWVSVVCADELPLVRIPIRAYPVNFTSTSGFRESYVVTAKKIGIPGQPFELYLDFGAEHFCVDAPAFSYSNSRFNGTDVVYAPQTAFRIPIRDNDCNQSTWAMGPGSSIWTIFRLATMTLTFGVRGTLILGERYEQAFEDMSTPRLIIPCEIFPTRCWLPGTVFNTQARIFVQPADYHIRLGSALWSQYLQALDRSHSDPDLQIQVQIGALTFMIDTQVMLSTLPGPSLSERLSPFAFSTPDWDALPRQVVELCTECILPTDVLLGSTLINVAIVFDSYNQRLEIGQAYQESRWTITNSMLTFVLIALLLHCYLNPLIRLPSFLSHEYDPYVEHMLGINTSRSVTQTTPRTRLDIELERIFVPFTYVPEIIGVALVIAVLILNATWLNFHRRLQFFVMGPLDNVSASAIQLGEDVLYFLLALVLTTLFVTHIYFFLLTPPASCLRNAEFTPSLIVLMRRFIYESELGIAVWITLVEGPLRTYYALLIFSTALFYIYFDTSYLLTYFFHMAPTRNWFITTMLILVYVQKGFLIIVYMLFPVVASIWPRYDVPYICILASLLMFFLVCFGSTVRQAVTLDAEVERLIKEAKKTAKRRLMTATDVSFQYS